MLILTIHGLGGSSFSHLPIKNYLETYLAVNERLNVKIIDYPSKTIEFKDAVKVVEDYLETYQWLNDSEEAILIGHSLGGIICTHVNHKRVKGIVSVSSPHKGCYLAEFVKSVAPTVISDFAFGKMYDILVTDANNSTIPKIICITSSFLPFYKFDGRVYTDEMVHPQAYKTIHLEYSEHITQLYDIRLFRLIYDAVDELVKL